MNIAGDLNVGLPDNAQMKIFIFYIMPNFQAKKNSLEETRHM